MESKRARESKCWAMPARMSVASSTRAEGRSRFLDARRGEEAPAGGRFLRGAAPDFSSGKYLRGSVVSRPRRARFCSKLDEAGLSSTRVEEALSMLKLLLPLGEVLRELRGLGFVEGSAALAVVRAVACASGSVYSAVVICSKLDETKAEGRLLTLVKRADSKYSSHAAADPRGPASASSGAPRGPCCRRSCRRRRRLSVFRRRYSLATAHR